MGTGLYDAAFATLVHLYGRNARTAITGITLLAGFASTVGWPLSSLMQAQMGWRGACLGWAALHLLLALPLYAAVPRRPAPPSGASPVQAPASSTAKPDGSTALSKPGARRRMALLLALLFTLMGFVSTSVATHLPALLQASGLTAGHAVAVAALAGPAQVASRLCEITCAAAPVATGHGRLAALGHPLWQRWCCWRWGRWRHCPSC
jgi:cyanate permease